VFCEAKAVHTGRSARNHLLALAQTNGISRQRVDEVIDLVGLRNVAGSRVGGFSLGMGQRLGVLWMRTMLKSLAAAGHTVFVWSQLMSEMAQTATRLVVIGRGRLIADITVEEFVARASASTVTVRTQAAARLRHLLLAPDITVTNAQPDVLQVDGLTAEQIGTVAWQARVPIYELAVQQVSLEQGFMTLTSDSVEYRSADPGAVAA
jgi:ABC-2 type transport system ATP-binding protein